LKRPCPARSDAGAAARNGWAARNPGPEPAGGAQQPVGGVDRRAGRRAHRHCRRHVGPRGGDRGERPCVLGWARSQGAGGAPCRFRRRAGLLHADYERLRLRNAANRASAAAGDRCSARRRHRRRLPAGRKLRTRGRLLGRPFCDARGQYWPVLFDPMVALSRNVARKHAMEMLLTGDLVGADDAQRIGLINRVVAPGTEREEALALARKIAAKSTKVVKIGKEAFYRQLELDLAGAYDYAAKVMVENMMAHDAQEGIAAFVEKRSPAWKDQ